MMKTLQLGSEERFKVLYDASFGGIVIHDRGVILECNDVLVEMSGYTREELIGMNGVLLFSEDTRQIVIDNIQHGYQKPYNAVAVHKNGKPFHVHIQAKDISFREKNVRVVEVRDITEQMRIETELRESEERFRALLEASGGGIAIHDTGIILECNDGLGRMFGYTYEELIGMNGLLLISKDSRDFVEEKIYAGYEKPYEAYGVRKDGHVFPVRIEARNVPYKGRNVRTAEFRDLTERKKLEAERFHVDKMKSLNEIAGSVAHDFNNFLFAILGNIDFARKENDEGKRSEHLSVAYEAAQKASSLTHQLLAISNGGVISKKVHYIKPLLEDVAQIVLKEETNHAYEITCDDPLLKVHVDQGFFSRVLHNLILNAKQAMLTHGVIKINASCAVNPDVAKGTFVHVSIEDTGIGIEEKHLKSIFTPFFTTKKDSGTNGLGLFSCYSIMQQHGGFITVDSTFGIGTVFHLYLPIEQIEEQVSEDEVKKASLVHDRSTSNKRILILDDEIMIRNMLSIMLETLGHTVVASSDGQETVDLYRESLKNGEVFDLVILDLTILGGMNGVETLKHLVALNPEVKAILSTGYSNVSPDEGFSKVLHKPYTLAELKKAIAEIL